MKETGQDLIKKNMYLITSRLTGIIILFSSATNSENSYKILSFFTWHLCTSNQNFWKKIKV